MWLAALGTCLLLYLLWMLRRRNACRGRRAGLVRPPIQQILADRSAVKYACKDFHTPSVSGYPLKLLVWLWNTRLLGNLITSRIIKGSGLDILAGEFIPEKPTYFPSPPPSSPDPSALTSSNNTTLEALVEADLRRDTPDNGFKYATVADFHHAYQSGKCTPVDVAHAVLQAIADSNKTSPPLRAIVDVDRDAVMEMALASADRWKQKKPLSLLDGVPVSVKGELCFEPYAFRGGSLFIPTCSQGTPEAVVVTKLRKAGAVIAGVANMQEFGTGTLGSNCNKLHLTARNPHNPCHYCGGSSSGGASSVAAGLCPVSIGGDGGGSVRIPAAVCGVVGLKPTKGLIDSTGVMPLDATVGTLGPLSSSVLDTAITMNLLLEGEKHSFSLSCLQQSFAQQEEGKPPLDGITVGVYWKFFEHADPEIVHSCKKAVEWLKELGSVVKDIVIPEVEEVRVAHTITILSEFANNLAVDTDQHFWEINPETILPITGGLCFSALEYLNAQKQRTRAVKVLQTLFEEVQVIVTPATACFAPVVTPAALHCGVSDATNSGRLMRYAVLANLTGIPGLVLPIGRSRSGLPIALQLMAPWHQEGLLIQVGWALECYTPAQLRPKVHYDLLCGGAD